MTRLALVLALFTLTACGADGPPVPPTKSEARTGISLSGEARIGIVK